MGQPVVHFEIVGKDAEKLRTFYGDLAGWEFQVFDDGPADYGIVERITSSNGAGIGGGVGEGPEGYEGHVTFYIEVPDVGAALDKAVELGGTKVMGPESPMEGLTIGLFTDPEGNTVGLVEPPQEG
jgi:uncharacterized protein